MVVGLGRVLHGVGQRREKKDYSGPTLCSGQGCYLKLANYHTPFGKPSSVIHDRVIRGTAAATVSLTPLEGVP